MSYGQFPPADGSGDQNPAWPAQAGPPAQAPAPAPAPEWAGGGSPMPPAGRRNPVPIVVVVVLTVALVAGMITVLVALSGTKEEPVTPAAPNPSTVAPSTPGPTSASPTSPNPTESSSEPGEGRATLPAELPSEAELDDWHFQYGAKELYAKKVAGTDYPSCAEVDPNGTLTDQGCIAAVEVDWEALDGDLTLATIILAMPDDSIALEIGMPGVIPESDVEAHFPDPVASPANTGIKTRGEGILVVITAWEAADSVSQDTLDEYITNMHLDISMSFFF